MKKYLKLVFGLSLALGLVISASSQRIVQIDDVSISSSDDSLDLGDSINIEADAEGDSLERIEILVSENGRVYNSLEDKECDDSSSCSLTVEYDSPDAAETDWFYAEVVAGTGSDEISEESGEINVGWEAEEDSPSIDLTAPRGNIDDDTPSFEWRIDDKDDPELDSVELAVDDDSTPFSYSLHSETFTSGSYNDANEDLIYSPDWELDSGSYRWGIRVDDDGSGGTKTRTTSFTVEADVGDDDDSNLDVDLFEPDGNIDDNSPNYEWRVEDDVFDEMDEVELAVDGDNTPFRGSLHSETFDEYDSEADANEDITYYPPSSWDLERDEDYTWGIRAENEDGDEETETESFNIEEDEDDEDPEADLDIRPDDADVGETITFDASDSTDDEGIDRFEFDFDDDGDVDETDYGDGVVRERFSSSYSGDAVVEVFDEEGNSDSASDYYRVRDDSEGPEAEFSWSPASPEVGKEVIFDGSGSSDDDGIVDYDWDFDDGSTSAGSTVTHSFDEAGVYRVGLTVEDNDGNTDVQRYFVSVSSDSDACGVDDGSVGFELEDDTIREGESTDAEATIYNTGTEDQDVRVRIKVSSSVVYDETRRVDAGGSRTFSESISPDRDEYVTAEVSTEGGPCGFQDLDDITRELIVLSGDRDRGSLDVEVYDEDYDPIRNAEVEADGPEDQVRYTDDDGEADFLLEAGDYDVTASHPGYRTETEEVEIFGDDNKDLEFVLSERGDRDRDDDDFEDDGLEITSVDSPDRVCRGDTASIDYTVRNYEDYDESAQTTARGFNKNIVTNRYVVEAGDTVSGTLRFTNVEGLGEEEFTIRVQNGTLDTASRTVNVENCDVSNDRNVGSPSSASISLSSFVEPGKALVGDTIKVTGYVDGVDGRTNVDIDVNGEVKASTATRPDGYYQTYIRMDSIGVKTVRARSGGVSASEEVEVLPTAAVYSVEAPRQVFEGDSLEVCADIESQIEPKLLLLRDGEVVQTKYGSGEVCFEEEGFESGTHVYEVTAVTPGGASTAKTSVRVLEAAPETTSFPGQIAAVESEEGLIKVELYNNNSERKTYNMELTGLPSTWTSQTSKQVILDTGQRETVYFYLTPRGEGTYRPEVEVSSAGETVYSSEVDLEVGGQKQNRGNSLTRFISNLLSF